MSTALEASKDSIGEWYGKPVEELSRDELLEVVASLSCKLKTAQEDHSTTLAILGD